jgi:hypothetical protein
MTPDPTTDADTYDLAAFSPLRILTASVLGDVFRTKIVPRGDPDGDGDSLHVHYCEYIECAGCTDHQLRVEGLIAIKDDPDFVKILRSRIYEELGRQLLVFPPLAEPVEPEAPMAWECVGDA